MKLPGGESAVVDINKLTEYCLNPLHMNGRHKARLFQSKLNLGQQDAEVLQERLLRAVSQGEATAGIKDEFGQRYTVDFDLQHGEMVARIRSAWIVRKGESVPRLTTCYVL